MEDFAGYIVNRIENNEELFLSVVGKFEEVKSLIKEIFCIAIEVDFEHLNIESSAMSGYEDEYVLDCWYMDGVIQIGCEPAKRGGEYFNIAGDETYLLEDCSFKIIPLGDDTKLYIVNIAEEYGCDEGCCGCCSCDCNDDDAEVIHYIVDGLTESDIITILKEFGF